MLWLIMSFIPDEWVRLAIHATVILGIAVYFGSGLIRFLTNRWLAGLPQLMLGIKAIGALLLIVGIFFEGGYGVEMEWRTKAAELQLKIAKAEAESADANLKIIEITQKRQQEKISIKVKVQCRGTSQHKTKQTQGTRCSR